MMLDIAPFARREAEEGGRALVFRWEEPRDIHRLVLLFEDNGRSPRSADITVSYWRRHWPQARATAADLTRGEIGSAGWKPRDDWFNGEWARAEIAVTGKGRERTVKFAPLARSEFPDLDGFNVTYRQTLGLRVELPDGRAHIKDVLVFTDTPLRAREIAVELGCGQDAAARDCGVRIYNGVLVDANPPNGSDPRLRLKAECAKAGPLSYDGTIITLHAGAFAVSFRPDDLDGGKPIWIPDLGVLVSETAWNLRYSDGLAARIRTGRCCYDLIAQQPEQSLSRALREQPPKEPMHFVIGCEGARQKFGVAPNGDLFAHVGFIRRVPAGDTARLGWPGEAFALRFGWDRWLRSGRRIARGYLPVIESRFSRGALDVVVEAFAAPLNESIPAGPAAGDVAIAALLRLTFVNTGDAPLSLDQPLRFVNCGQHSVGTIARNAAADCAAERLRLDGDVAWAEGEQEYVRIALDTRGLGEMRAHDGCLGYRCELPAGARHSIILKVPFLGLLSADEIERLRAKDFEAERAQAIAYWERRVAQAAQIIAPDQDIADFHRAHLTHILINDDHEAGAERIIGRVSSFNYGNYSNEAVMQIMELDRRGLHQEARRHLETYLHYQGTVALPGNYQGTQGVFYGSGGYECGGYNQHHGWVLWGLAEHYRFTGDREWLLSIADGLIAGCEWVIRERQATKRTEAAGRRVLEYGFLPAGSLEDVTDYHYWLSTNALTARGLSAAAQALADAGHPEGGRLVTEAAAYREDLLAGFREARARSPAVRLRDGTYVPHHPSRLHWRGRDFGWIREVLEGSINLVTSILDPQSRESTWILKDYEDNRYLDAPYNYPLDNFDGQWFSRGGFSMQPNLLYFTPPYLLRDEIERFLRAFFNGFAACWRADIRALTEHPLPTLADWAGDHFKSSDEAMAAMWLRMMFIHEEGDTLHLGRGLPRAWLADERGVAIKNAATYFGPMSFEMRPRDGGARIIAQIEPPVRTPPRQIIVRFRHPQKARLAGAEVNGKPADALDVEKEWVVLPAQSGPVVVEARFEVAS